PDRPPRRPRRSIRPAVSWCSSRRKVGLGSVCAMGVKQERPKSRDRISTVSASTPLLAITLAQATTEPEPGTATARILLAARGLRKAFGGQVILAGVDLELHQGDVVLLRGENGSGKTTLLNILSGNLEPD